MAGGPLDCSTLFKASPPSRLICINRTENMFNANFFNQFLYICEECGASF